ncbi:hypothetical protein [Acidianus sp. RZ1]|uniref:hypothetical protein n=1 Tax=Acidianus sp. RZ1 TaxID=1540082 RepID=UPI0014926F9D|nr:hypothetical protein [Acidianus sp. RZ1]
MIVEGYFVRYKDAIWAVKGCFHPEGHVVAVPRVIGNLKLKTMEASLKVVRERFPNLLRYIEEIGFEVPIIPLDSAEILDPFKVKYPEKVKGMLKRLINVGITGSYLYQGNGEDIDFLSFDPKNYAILKDLRNEEITSPLDIANENEVEGLELQDFLALKKRRLLEGKYNGIPYTFKIVECERFGKVIKKHFFKGRLKIVKAIKPFSIPVKYLTDQGLVLTSFRTRFTELHEGTSLDISGLVMEREDFNDLDLDIAHVKLLYS